MAPTRALSDIVVQHSQEPTAALTQETQADPIAALQKRSRGVGSGFTVAVGTALVGGVLGGLGGAVEALSEAGILQLPEYIGLIRLVGVTLATAGIGIGGSQLYRNLTELNRIASHYVRQER